MIVYRLSPDVSNKALNTLFSSAWNNHKETDFVTPFQPCANWVCATYGETIVGIMQVVEDDGAHGFVRDNILRSAHQRSVTPMQTAYKGSLTQLTLRPLECQS